MQRGAGKRGGQRKKKVKLEKKEGMSIVQGIQTRTCEVERERNGRSYDHSPRSSISLSDPSETTVAFH
jgi:hypothetical protein